MLAKICTFLTDSGALPPLARGSVAAGCSRDALAQGHFCSLKVRRPYFIKEYFSSKIILCTTLLPPFFSEIRGFIVKHWLYIYDSKYCPSLTITFSHLRVAYESGVEKIGHLLRLSTNRSNFLLLHKTGSAGQPGPVSLIETSDNQREQRLENTAGGVGLPISTFPSMS